MGESNAVFGRQKGVNGLKRDALMALEGIYRELHGGNEQGEGKWEIGIPATFRIIYMVRVFLSCCIFQLVKVVLTCRIDRLEGVAKSTTTTT